MLAEKWDGHDPKVGTSSMDWTFFGSLDASGLATYDRLNRDEYASQYGFDKEVIIKCISDRPDLIFSTSWLLSPLKIRTLKLIREYLDMSVIVTWGDIENHVKEAEALAPFVDYNLTLRKIKHSSFFNRVNDPNKYLRLFSSFDPTIFYNPRINRDIDVSFLGSMKAHPDRHAGISALRNNGINVIQSAGLRENRLSINEYADVYKHSKIALNFCYHPNGQVQVKGRVFEAISCGALLLEAENTNTAEFFEPMVDYVPFSDERDLVDKVRYYLSHGAEREEIAANGHKKLNEKYSANIFWKTVLENVLT